MLASPCPKWCSSTSKPPPVVPDFETPVAAVVNHDGDRARLRVLGGVLQRLEAAEVDGRLDRLREAADPLSRDAGRQRRTAGDGLQGLLQPAVDQERGIHAGRQRPYLVEGIPHVLAELAQLLGVRQMLFD
jgi:hypothetical protein